MTDRGEFPGGFAEECDAGGVDTATCDADCTAPVCGDGHVNTQADEVCDSDGIDTADYDADCTSAQCGDGYLNRPAGEQCETNEDCLPSYRCRISMQLELCTCVL